MGSWSHGLCSCFDNCTLCIITYFVPCFTQGKTAEKVGESCIFYGACMFVPLANLWFGTKLRGLVREAKGIEGSFVSDLLMYWCCTLCAVIQAEQEMLEGGTGQQQSMARE